MGSGSLELALAPGVPSTMSEKATRTNDTATFVCLSMTTHPEADIHHLFNYMVGAREWRASKVFTLT